MNILALDTSSRRLCLGLMNNEGRVLGYDLDAEVKHAELILPAIKKALSRLGLSPDKLDYFAVGLGPGSFTGLRIGLATIKGFATGLNKQVVGIPTLDLLATNALVFNNNEIICPLVDAKRGLVFTAFYEVSSNKKIKRKSPYLLINVEELLKGLSPYKIAVFLGDGLKLYQEGLLYKKKKSIFLDEKNWYPKAKNLITLACDLINKRRFINATKVKPMYLYPKECQIKNAKASG